jgi:tRNA U34 5-methylaminomethyl-2-thiouridine-forming methyltransferase MnmC
MKKEILITSDGSSTIKVPEWNVTYHSVHGAIQESRHVFIESGLKFLLDRTGDDNISILEVGFGTGLNALLTAIEVEKRETSIYYVALDPFPISVEVASSLNYCEQLQRKDLQENFRRMHECGWNKSIAITENILMHKSRNTLQDFEYAFKYDLIYYDAFAPAAQPELWTEEIFQKLFGLLKPNGVIVTYCSKGDVRRAMMAAGFTVKKLPGPPGKREILRATRN